MAEILCRAAGMCEANCYIIKAPAGDIVIDPGDDAEAILDFIESTGSKPECVLLTHGHFDHVLSAYTVKQTYGAKVYIGTEDAPALTDRDTCMVLPYAVTPFTPCEPDGCLEEGEEEFCGLKFRVLKTPGHTPGGVSLLIEEEKLLFSGDTLFAHGYGRTDFPGGSMEELIASLKRLLSLPGDIRVYPGHYESATISSIKKGYSL